MYENLEALENTENWSEINQQEIEESSINNMCSWGEFN